jgi:hypothetical protein
MTTLCPPLRVPSGPGDLSFYGRFAIAYAFSQFIYDEPPQISIYLERCGSQSHTRLNVPFAVGGYSRNLTDFPPSGLVLTANAREIMWIKGARQLAGVFLPSMRAFTVPLPANIKATSEFVGGDTGYYPSHIALGSQILYLVDGNSRLWTAPAPTISQAHP